MMKILCLCNCLGLSRVCIEAFDIKLETLHRHLAFTALLSHVARIIIPLHLTLQKGVLKVKI